MSLQEQGIHGVPPTQGEHRETQVCTTCGQEMPLGEFWKQPSKVSGYQAECKYCMRGRNRRWWKKNKVAARIRYHGYWSKHRLARPEYSIWKACKDRASQYGMEFSLLLEDIVIPERCPVLGIKLEAGMGRGRGLGLIHRDKSPSIDRVDNSKGYTPDNILVVSYRANRIKSDATVEELVAVSEFYRRRSCP